MRARHPPPAAVTPSLPVGHIFPQREKRGQWRRSVKYCEDLGTNLLHHSTLRPYELFKFDNKHSTLFIM